MGSSVRKAIELILSANPELLNILSTTARVCLTSSILALLIGVPVEILLGAERFPGRKVLCRILMRRYDLLVLDEPSAAMDMESTYYPCAV